MYLYPTSTLEYLRQKRYLLRFTKSSRVSRNKTEGLKTGTPNSSVHAIVLKKYRVGERVRTNVRNTNGERHTCVLLLSRSMYDDSSGTLVFATRRPSSPLPLLPRLAMVPRSKSQMPPVKVHFSLAHETHSKPNVF